jgi:Leucine-rich repeat (LRR) protein
LFFLRKAIEWGADCSEIKELDLAGRQLKDLPAFPWEKLENLRMLDLEGNNLDIIPVSLAFLPQLERVV